MNIQIFNDEELVASEKDKTLISSKAKNIWVTKKNPVTVIFKRSSQY